MEGVVDILGNWSKPHNDSHARNEFPRHEEEVLQCVLLHASVWHLGCGHSLPSREHYVLLHRTWPVNVASRLGPTDV